MSNCKDYEQYEKTETLNVKNREYQIGTCYSCQKCLYCNVNLVIEYCSCNKTIKPTNSKKKETAQVGSVRNGVYNPHRCHYILAALLHSSSQLYRYNSNFSKKFNFTLCSKCNSQLTRDQNTYNKKNEKNKDPAQENNQISTNGKSEIITKQSDKFSIDDVIPNADSFFRFKLVIKTPDLTKPAKAITLEKKPVDYYEFEELISQRVCEAVGLLVRTDYELSYKSEKGIGAGTILEEEEDFEEFIKEYSRLTNSNKVLLITASIQKKETAKRKKKNLTLDDDEESIDEENEITPPSKQKKKISIPKEANLNEIDLIKGEIHKKLKEKHGCDIHKTGYCYVKDNRHLPLTTLHLSMWTDEIHKNHCDYETPPPHPNFGMGNSLKISSSNHSSSSTLVNNDSTNSYSHYNIPPNVYPYYYGWPPYPPPHPSQHPPQHLSQHPSQHPPSYPPQHPPSYPPLHQSSQHLLSLNSSNTLTLQSDTLNNNNNTEFSELSMKEFLEQLDKQYGEANIQTFYKSLKRRRLLYHKLQK
ncbi:hypothetical protein RclHR1_15190003 [Rhizophagus clarus]|uniref:Uncharacterized protein n=1 Tax=Rhizophagus clarus TaxID=94130 RepID=A0A2Z6QEI3_9GLOM|nr:hypothetical protein RclHR1_15190003 [Rhizophagus clarus]